MNAPVRVTANARDAIRSSPWLAAVPVVRAGAIDVDEPAALGRPPALRHDIARIPVRHTAPESIQAKLAISDPGDKHEQEADRVAERIMRMPLDSRAEEEGSFSRNGAVTIQRKCTACEQEEEEEVQRWPSSDNRDRIQAKTLPGRHAMVTPAIRGRIEAMRGGGTPLPPSARRFFEPRFAADFSNTRIHTGAAAAQTARLLKARAFTLGRDIFFDAAEFQPATQSGRMLLAHELTHVIQQTGSGARQRPKGAGRNGFRGESDGGPGRSFLRGAPPRNAAPTIMRLSPERFQSRLGRSDEQAIVVRELFEHSTFRKLWDWLGRCECDRGDHGPIKLRVHRTFSEGVQTFGGFDQKRGVLTINPAMPAARENPQELVDTIVHEVVHAISWAWRNKLCPGQRPPLQQLDIVSAPTGERTLLERLQARKAPCNRTRFPVAPPPESLKLANLRGGLSELDQLETLGPSASDPCSRFIDIREQPQEQIVEIIADIQQRTGIGGPTRTSVNQILRDEVRRARPIATSYSEIVERAPLLGAFIRCRDEECAEPRRKRNLHRCFDRVLQGEPSIGAAEPSIQRLCSACDVQGEMQSEEPESEPSIGRSVAVRPPGCSDCEEVQRASNEEPQARDPALERSDRRLIDWALRLQRRGAVERWNDRLRRGKAIALRSSRVDRADRLLQLAADDSTVAERLGREFMSELDLFVRLAGKRPQETKRAAPAQETAGSESVDSEPEEPAGSEAEEPAADEPDPAKKTPAEVLAEEVNRAEQEADADARRHAIPTVACTHTQLQWKRDFNRRPDKGPNDRVAFTHVNFKEAEDGSVSAELNPDQTWAWHVLRDGKFPACASLKRECRAIPEGKQKLITYHSQFCTGQKPKTVDRKGCSELPKECEEYQLAERERLRLHEQGHLDIGCIVATLVNERVPKEPREKRLRVASNVWDAVVEEYDGSSGFGTKAGCFIDRQDAWNKPEFMWRRVEQHLKQILSR